MGLTAGDIMQSPVQSAHPSMSLVELDRMLLEKKIGGVPVVDNGQLVGVVSHTDVLKRMMVEQSVGEIVTDFYSDFSWPDEKHSTATPDRIEEIGGFVGERYETLTVRDVMNPKIVSVQTDTPLAEVASTMLKKQLHRMLVTRDGAVVGIVTTTDFLRAIAEQKLA